MGSVWIAVSSPERTVSRLIRVRGNRSKVIRKAGSAALSLLEEEMLTEKQPVIILKKSEFIYFFYLVFSVFAANFAHF